jgi:hypothetical protein
MYARRPVLKAGMLEISAPGMPSLSVPTRVPAHATRVDALLWGEPVRCAEVAETKAWLTEYLGFPAKLVVCFF